MFLGTFVAPSRSQVAGRPSCVIADGVAAPKFLADVEQRTFSGQYAAAAGQPVLYVTERCVFRLTPDGLELIEIAPGVDLEKDVLAHIGFDAHHRRRAEADGRADLPPTSPWGSRTTC